MHPIEAFVRNPVKVAVGVLMVTLFGFIGLARMPMQLTPEVNVPTITIETRWPGRSPQEVEREIILEQEEQLQSVQGVTKLTSECMDSNGRISLQFQVGTDMQVALVQVNSRLAQVPEYPVDADEPVVSTSDASDRPVAWFILSSRLPTREQIAEFQQNHSELTDLLEPAHQVADQNQGLATLRLKRLAGRHDRLRQALPSDWETAGASDDAIQSIVKKYDDLAPLLDSVLRTTTSERVFGLQKLCDELMGIKEVLATELLPQEIDIPKMRKFSEDHIESRFERVSGVSNSNVFGGQEIELQVVVDPHRLAARGLTIIDVRNSLRGHNRDTSAGDFYEGKRRWVVRTVGQYRSIKQVEEQVIAMHDGQPIFLKDVCVPFEGIRIGHKKSVGLVRRFGSSAIAINAERSTNANVLDVMEGLRGASEEMNLGILRRQGLQLTQVYDETDYINSAVGLVNQNILFGGFLTIVVLLLFLRSGRSTLVIGLAIPTSLIGTFLILNLLGRSLNVISLAGLAFAVGMLVDNAVVVLENIYRHHQRGERPFVAAVQATQEVWGAVVASTLTTLAVFLPVLFIEEEAGQLFRDIALAISSAVGLSLLVSVTVIPAAAARVLQRVPTSRRGGNTVLQRSTSALDHFGLKFVSLVVGFNAWTQKAVVRQVCVAGILIGGSLATSYAMWPKVEYLPSGNRNLVLGFLLPPPGYNLDELMSMGATVEEELKPYWDVDYGGGKNDTLDGPVIRDWFYVARGRQVFLGLRAVEPTRAWELVQLLPRKVRGRFPGTLVVASQSSLFQRGLGAGRSIDVEITGPRLDKLVQLGGRVMGQVSATLEPNVPANGSYKTQVRPLPSLDLSSPELHVVPRTIQSAGMEVNAVDLGYTIDALVDGAYATNYYLGGDKIDLTIIGNEQIVRHTQDVEALPVAAPNGQVVPLMTIADVQLNSGPEQINRRERQRAITIQVTPPPAMALQEAIDLLTSEVIVPLQQSGGLEDEATSERYVINLSGTADQLRETWRALRWNVLIALLITYLLMAALFESWLHPLVIILSVPLAAVGGVLGLNMLNLYKQAVAMVLDLPAPPPQALDVLTMLGFVILIGTAVNNAILIVHQSLNHMRGDVMGAREAVLESVRNRIRPIFMTTTTTCFGLAPLVFFPGAGSELYSGLGSVVLGGLLCSTLFTLVLVPTLFSLFLWVKNLSKTASGEIEVADRSLLEIDGTVSGR